MAVILAERNLLLVLGGVILAILYYSFPARTRLDEFWKEQDFSGLPSGLFQRFRGGLSTIKSCRAIVLAGYEKSLKTTRGFFIPVLGSEPIYILPHNSLRDAVKQPDTALDPVQAPREQLQLKYTMGEDVIDSPYNLNFIKNQLTRTVGVFAGNTVDELGLGFADQWGRRAEWTSVKAFPASMGIVSRAANRVFAGTTLCRNEAFLKAARDYSVSIFACGSILNLFPKLLRPALAPLVNMPIKKQLRITYKEALPMIKKRMELIEQAKRSGNVDAIPNDAITWLVEESIKTDAKRNTKKPEQYEASGICRHLLSLNMVAVQTTSIVSTNLILDLYSSPNADEMVAGLREEIDRVYKAHNHTWTKAAIDDLVRVDSAIRESLRLTPLQIFSMQRTIKEPAGVDLGNGVNIPKGTIVATPTAAIHQDKRFYPNAHEFDAFRWSRPLEQQLAKEATHGKRESDSEQLAEVKKHGLVTTNDTFLGFGHGRHACPGRFFASQLLKLMVIHILMDYDIRLPDGKRPPNTDFNNLCIPSNDATIEVRWRGKS